MILIQGYLWLSHLATDQLGCTSLDIQKPGYLHLMTRFAWKWAAGEIPQFWCFIIITVFVVIELAIKRGQFSTTFSGRSMDQAGKLTLSLAGHSCCFMLLILNSYSWCWWQKEKNRMIFPQNIHISSGQGDRNPISGAATRRAARWWKGAYTIWVDHKVNGRWIEGFKQQDLCCSHTGLDV